MFFCIALQTYSLRIIYMFFFIILLKLNSLIKCLILLTLTRYQKFKIKLCKPQFGSLSVIRTPTTLIKNPQKNKKITLFLVSKRELLCSHPRPRAVARDNALS